MIRLIAKLFGLVVFSLHQATVSAQPADRKEIRLTRLVVQASPVGTPIWKQLLDGGKSALGIELAKVTSDQKKCLEDKLVGEGFTEIRKKDVEAWIIKNPDATPAAIEVLDSGAARIARVIRLETSNPKFNMDRFLEKEVTAPEAQSYLKLMTEQRFESLRQLLGISGITESTGSRRDMSGVALLLSIEANAGQSCDIARK
jgi:hypothetical protein